MVKKKFDTDQMILGLFLRMQKDLIQVSDPYVREKVWKQINSLPENRPEKEILKEKFQLHCDIHDHGYVCNIDQIDPKLYSNYKSIQI
jgi:hypothetical protein